MKQFKIDFYGHRKIFFTISLSIMAIGLICNFVFGTKLDIQFTGGAMVKYSYSGDIDSKTVQKVVQDTTKRDDVSITVNKDVKSADGKDTLNNITVSFTGTQNITVDTQKSIAQALNKQYPKANFGFIESDSVDASMGKAFFEKCLVAILIAFLILILYVAARFKNIGGMASGMMAIVALLHDVIMVYFMFIIFRIPLNDNFIAVVLTILGYSLNDTIVIYDRIRENRKLMGLKAGYPVLVNTSINQNFSRTLYTSITTFLAIFVVFIVGQIYHLTSITTFALPMMIGIVSGCYSSDCIAGPLYVMWENHKIKLKTAAIAAADSGKSTQAEITDNKQPAVKVASKKKEKSKKKK